MKYVLALDQGTTSSRALLFDHDTRVVGVAQQEFEQHFPRPGWVEHDPDTIWRSQLDVAREVLETTGVVPSEIAAIGIANQRETTVVWDRRTGRPVGNAIVWQDRRTAERCRRLVTDGHLPLIRSRTGLLADAYFSASKIEWILDSSPGLRDRAEAGEFAFGTIDSWLVWQLLGGRHVTDPSNASRTQLFDVHRGDWCDDLLQLFGIPRSMLPEVVGNSEVVGETVPEWFGGSIPVAGMAGDQQAALFGQVCFSPGLAKNTYGTGCFALVNTGETAADSDNELLTSVAWRIGDRTEYALEGSVFVAGAAVQWLRDGLGILESASEVEALAASVEDSGGVQFVPAFTGLGAPHWDSDARGTLVGLTRGTTRAHVARATLEGIAHQVVDVLDAMQADTGRPLAELRVDGGASRNDLLMQMQADLLGYPVVRPETTETTALGAALLAGLAVGFWPNREAVAERWQVERRFEPNLSSDEVSRSRDRWRDAVARASGVSSPPRNV